jgi:hypothetical protein
MAAPMLANEWLRCLLASNSRSDDAKGSNPSRSATLKTKRSRSCSGKGRSRSVLTALKIAVFAPMLKARAATAMAV